MTESIDTILYLIRKQTPVGAAQVTYSPCPNCGQSSRGGDRCIDCLVKVAMDMGVSERHISLYRAALAQRQEVELQIQDIAAEIREGVTKR